MLMLRALALALICFTPVSALALSCVPHGVVHAYQEALAAQESYVPVYGVLQFDTDALPKMDVTGQTNVPPVTLIPARFVGHALNARGVDQPFETDVVLEVRCSGPWCPQPRPGKMLGFLRKTSHSYVLHTNACGGFLFGRPTSKQVTELRDCLAGRPCTARRRP